MAILGPPILDFTLRDLIGTDDRAIVNSHVFLTECTFSDIQNTLLVFTLSAQNSNSQRVNFHLS